ncbi:hypothetical protein EV363DRAFT_1329678 [Boletus edulis]|uniref:Uncharacterized protein n=1 Tax=Boletus edulis BED1 TaxID=1328754 RepID=A0AAD4BN47_BOLED|nr:hypothetical protein EV363DRAFT_1329678 [Boletus edulis]KAF8435179.1 hypothetical protein L210DRAFT_3552094 [Boletus edulis BED1]
MALGQVRCVSDREYKEATTVFCCYKDGVVRLRSLQESYGTPDKDSRNGAPLDIGLHGLEGPGSSSIQSSNTLRTFAPLTGISSQFHNFYAAVR